METRLTKLCVGLVGLVLAGGALMGQGVALTCAPDKTVALGSSWNFDLPEVDTQQAYLVYDNSVHDLLYRFNPGSLEIGDEINLAGTARYLTEFSFEYWGLNTSLGNTFAGAVKARVRFYKNDGPLVSGYASPGTLIYDSGEFEITATPRATLIFDQATLHTGVVPLAANVPDKFTWTVQFSGLGADDQAGVDLYSPVVLGSSYPDYWERSASGWLLKNNPSVNVDFAAKALAAPVTVLAVSTTTNALCAGSFEATRLWVAIDAWGSQALCGQKVTALNPRPGDLNHDGCVDLADLNLLLAKIRVRSTDRLYDINCDGLVNIADSRKLVLLFNNPGGAACPQP